MAPPGALRIATAAVAAGSLIFVPGTVAPASTSSPPLGVVAQSAPAPEELDAMREGGVASFRWLISWPAVQPRAEAEPDLTSTDRIVASLAERGIVPIPVIWGSPCYAVDCEAVPEQGANRQPPIGSRPGRRAWARFLEALVDRYGTEGSLWSENPELPRRPITTWQVWNEQNAPNFYTPGPSVAGYAELLRVSARAIRSRDREATILLGGLAADPGGRGAIDGPTYLERLYRVSGARRSFDAVAVHPYAADVAGVERHMLAFRDVLEKRDPQSPVWVTEVGWGTSEGGEGRRYQTVDGQAEALTAALTLLTARREEWNLAGVLWFAWRDPPPDQRVCAWCRTAGLLAQDGDPRPAWTAFTDLAGGAPGGEAEPEGDGPSVPLLAALAVAGAIAGSGLFLISRARRRSGGSSQ